MKTTNEIKKWLTENLGVTVKGNTGTGKSKWQSFRVPSDSVPIAQLQRLQYSLPEFPLAFRQLCLRTIYGSDCKFAEHGNAGNVSRYNIAMIPSEWEKVMELWPTVKDTPAA